MPKFKWDKESCHKEALKHSTRTEWYKNSGSSYNSAYKNGWVEELSSHMERLLERHTRESILNDAKKYTQRTKWARESKGYSAAQRMGILEEACAHMEYSAYPWTKDEIFEDAKKYSSRADWAKSSRGYWVAQSHGWLRERQQTHEKGWILF